MILRKNFTFPRIQRGSNNSRGGGGPTFSRGEMHINCDFPGGYRLPIPLSGSAHGHVRR